MAARIEVDGKFFRLRRGILIQIPEGWVGRITTPQTIARRKSKGGQGRTYKCKAQR